MVHFLHGGYMKKTRKIARILMTPTERAVVVGVLIKECYPLFAQCILTYDPAEDGPEVAILSTEKEAQ